MPETTKKLNPQQQDALNRIMSVPTVPSPAQTYQVPELSSQSANNQSANPAQPSNKPQVQSIGAAPVISAPPGAMTTETVKKKSMSPMIIVFVVVGIVAVVLYLFVWLKIFKIL